MKKYLIGFALLATLFIVSFAVYAYMAVKSQPSYSRQIDLLNKRDRRAREESPLQSGDIVFQNVNSSQCKAIELATGSPWTHVGIVFADKGQLFVYEAVQPVRITPLDKWIQHGRDDIYVAKRIAGANTLLTPEVVQKMKAIGKSHIGKDYDLYFEWSDKRMYCSEFVWKIYNEVLGVEIGELKPLRSFRLNHPVVRAKLQERYGDNIPLDEKMISPGDMFDSELLETVVDEEE